MEIKINKKGNIKNIVETCFPEYKGRKIRLSDDFPEKFESYWNEGSLNFYAFYDLASKRKMDVQSNHPFFEENAPRNFVNCPPNVVCVEHTIFCGHDLGITIYVNLPGELSLENVKERIALLS